MYIRQADCVKIQIIRNDQQNARQRYRPAPVKCVFLIFAPEISDQVCRSENENEVDGKPQLECFARDHRHTQQVFVIQCRSRAENRAEQDEMDAFVSSERNAFQFSEYGEKIISDEDRKHSDSLQRARNFMKKKNSADYGPERRTCADRRCNGDRQFAHCIIDAGPTGCHKDGLCQDQEPVMRFGDDGG